MNNYKKIYEVPEISFTVLSSRDVITFSNNANNAEAEISILPSQSWSSGSQGM